MVLYQTQGVLGIRGLFLILSCFRLARLQRGSFFYHFGVLRETCHNGNLLSFQDAAGPSANGNDCWELVEFNGPISVARDLEGGHLSMNSKKEGGKGLLIGKQVA